LSLPAAASRLSCNSLLDLMRQPWVETHGKIQAPRDAPIAGQNGVAVAFFL
jgi:hypothetical protein